MHPEIMIINPFFLLLLLLPLISFLISKNFISRRAPQIPPGPYQWPLVGNIFQLGKLPHHTIARLAQTHGPLMSLKLGSKLLVVGSSPAVAREILKIHDRALSGRFVRPEFRTQTDDHDDQWSRMRSVGRSELFSGKAIESQATLWSEKIDEMVEDLRAEAGSVVEIEEKAYVVTLNILGNLIFSGDLVGFDGKGLHGEGLHGEMRGLIRGFADLDLTPNLTDLFPVLGDWDLFGMNNKFREVFKKMLATWDGIELFSAGLVSATSTITWALAELIKNREIMQKLRDELEKELGQDNVKQSDLPRLPYLDACIKETLRLHPPAPLLLPHRALESCNVMGYDIPEDTIVTVNVWALGRDPSIWDNPLSFNPERFLVSGLDYKGNDYKYLPFGSGRRMCPGQPMAAKVVPLILGTLIHLFDWSLPGDMDPANLDMEEKNSITLVKEKHLCLVPKIRKQLEV
ncbi:hypothetical protein RHGRI_008458 [Rhododendron griersonianum]|uniref:Cytochrome P450 n=1 Tax=Rhododendron griersonianum TaxID=479676 RepID=A0AAV6L1G7_9ERIC|nr:hypothetical protein RHGRI_008458 [Rhododendron griersonianum]